MNKKYLWIGGVVLVVIVLVILVVLLSYSREKSTKQELLDLLEKGKEPREYTAYYHYYGGRHVNTLTDIFFKIKRGEVVFINAFYHEEKGTAKPYSQEAYHLYDLEEGKDDFTWNVLSPLNPSSEINDAVELWAEGKKEFDMSLTIPGLSNSLISLIQNLTDIDKSGDCFNYQVEYATYSKICFKDGILDSYESSGSSFGWVGEYTWKRIG